MNMGIGDGRRSGLIRDIGRREEMAKISHSKAFEGEFRLTPYRRRNMTPYYARSGAYKGVMSIQTYSFPYTSLTGEPPHDSPHFLLTSYLDMTCRYSPQYSLLLPTARAAGTRKVDNADSLAGIGNGHRAPDSIQLESRGKYEGMIEARTR